MKLGWYLLALGILDGGFMTEIQDDPRLLASMLIDGARADPVWKPAAYWLSYCRRIERELEHTGLAGLRTNQALLKGFASGGTPLPTPPRAAWKRSVWRILETMPGVATVIAEYRRLLVASHGRANDAEVRFARLALDRIAETCTQIAPPEGLANGGAENTFVWQGHTVTADWVTHLARLADFYRAVPADQIKAILEIGPGLGLSTLAHIALNPGLRMIVNCDIPPVLYISTQYLKSIPTIEVVDCRAAMSDDGVLRPRASDRPTVYQLASWQMPYLNFEADAFFNAFSFQEMELDICRRYADAVAQRVNRYVLLHSSVAGHAPGAGDQKQPVSIEFLRQIFGGAFPKKNELGTLWTELYDNDPRQVLLLSRS